MSTLHQVLLIGDWDRTAYRAARRELDRVLPAMIAANVPQALEMLERASGIGALLIAQSFPGEFTFRHIQQLQSAAPLARLCVLLDSWSEGETRSGHPWPGVPRMYLHQLWARLRSEDWSGTGPDPLAAWSSLPTLAADELWLQRADRRLPSLEGTALIWGHEPDSRAALSDLCRAVGLRAIGLQITDPVPPVEVRLALYDAAPYHDRRDADLRRIAARAHRVPLIALIDFPRRDEIAAATAAGCSHVLGKPFLIDDLLACLHDALVHPNPVC
jgi:hypothetical protein